jgi:chromosome segregation ATPase
MIVLCGLLTVGLFIAVLSAYQWRQKALERDRGKEILRERLKKNEWARDELAGKLGAAQRQLEELEGKQARAEREIATRGERIDLAEDRIVAFRRGRERWSRAIHELLEDMRKTFDGQGVDSTHEKMVRGLDARDAAKWRGHRR